MERDPKTDAPDSASSAAEVIPQTSPNFAAVASAGAGSDLAPMTTADRDRAFEEGLALMRLSLSGTVRRMKGNPLALVFVFAHRSAGPMHEMARSAGGESVPLGFTLSVQPRRGHPAGRPGLPLAEIPADQIACVLSVADRYQEFGVPLEALFDRPVVVEVPRG